MRDIKFRAWIESDRQMYDVLQLQQPFPDEGFYRVFINKARTPDAPMNYRITGGNAIMQFTGLKDKNGKEIYEGDVVRWDDGSEGKYWRVAEVFYDDDAMFSFRIIKNTMHELSCEEGYVFGGNFMYRDGSQLEVIGNIYDNPLPPS